MKVLVAIAPDRYRDEELDEPLAVFRRHDIGFDIASTREGPCTGMLGGEVLATLSFRHANPSDYSGLVIIGGAGSPPHLWQDRDLAALVAAFAAGHKLIAAICLSPVVLARAGILNGRKATVFRTPEAVAEMMRGGAILTSGLVITEGRVITADGPAAARAFGEAIVTELSR
jgi:protease I